MVVYSKVATVKERSSIWIIDRKKENDVSAERRSESAAMNLVALQLTKKGFSRLQPCSIAVTSSTSSPQYFAVTLFPCHRHFFPFTLDVMLLEEGFNV
jgi:hypothetical protein